LILLSLNHYIKWKRGLERLPFCFGEVVTSGTRLEIFAAMYRFKQLSFVISNFKSAFGVKRTTPTNQSSANIKLPSYKKRLSVLSWFWLIIDVRVPYEGKGVVGDWSSNSYYYRAYRALLRILECGSPCAWLEIKNDTDSLYRHFQTLLKVNNFSQNKKINTQFLYFTSLVLNGVWKVFSSHSRKSPSSNDISLKFSLSYIFFFQFGRDQISIA